MGYEGFNCSHFRRNTELAPNSGLQMAHVRAEPVAYALAEPVLHLIEDVLDYGLAPARHILIVRYFREQ